MVKANQFIPDLVLLIVAELDFLGLLEKRDRTELRTILAEYKLLFLRPKFSDEQFLFTERGRFKFLYA